MEDKFKFYTHGQFSVEVPEEKIKLISTKIWINALGFNKSFILDSVTYYTCSKTYLVIYKQKEE